MGVAYLEFRGENFRGWLKNREIRESFLPRKFPAIRYILVTKRVQQRAGSIMDKKAQGSGSGKALG